MSLYDYFRRAFLPHTSPGQPGFRNPIWEEESDDDDELDDEFRYSPHSPFGFRIFSGDVIDMHKYFEQQMDEMLKNFHSTLIGTDLLQLPDNFVGSSEVPDKDAGASKYLKPWYEQSTTEQDLRKDTDIDGRITSGDLTRLFPTESEGNSSPATTQVPKTVFGKSVITRILRNSDGRMEEEKRVRKSDGQEEVSLTRQIGDQKYKVITKKDAQSGITNMTEELINLDEDKLDEFNKKWEAGKSKKPSAVPQQDHSEKIVTFYPTTDSGSGATPLIRLFEKWFNN